MTKYAINGRFLTRQMTGVDRYAYEITRSIIEEGNADIFCLVVPNSAHIPPELSDILIERTGARTGAIWEQVDFPAFVNSRNLIPVNLCNTAPLLNPGIVCIHDMNVRANPNFYSSKFRLWYQLLYASNIRNAKMILTDSSFSKEEIERYYPAAKGKTTVISCAWQHMDRIESDNSIFDKYPMLKKGEYYYAMSSLAPNKNLSWLVETAKLNPCETIAIAGGLNQKVFGEHSIPEADNVIYLGYIRNEEAKALMQYCKGFLFPTFYEGFGIPPIEAISCSAKVAVSDASCMREVYQDYVAYLNPNQPCRDLRKLFQEDVRPGSGILHEYSWLASSKRLLKALEEMEKWGS